MNDFKKTIQALDGKAAFVIVALGALLGFIFFLVLPAIQINGKIFYDTISTSFKGTDLFSLKIDEFEIGTPFPLFIFTLINLLAPLALLVYAFLKKQVSVCLPILLFVSTLFVGTYFSGIVDGDVLKISMGIGTIFNMVIYFLVAVFSFFRKGAPINIQ